MVGTPRIAPPPPKKNVHTLDASSLPDVTPKSSVEIPPPPTPKATVLENAEELDQSGASVDLMAAARRAALKRLLRN
jgi:hypothetical protein